MEVPDGKEQQCKREQGQHRQRTKTSENRRKSVPVWAGRAMLSNHPFKPASGLPLMTTGIRLVIYIVSMMLMCLPSRHNTPSAKVVKPKNSKGTQDLGLQVRGLGRMASWSPKPQTLHSGPSYCDPHPTKVHPFAQLTPQVSCNRGLGFRVQGLGFRV